MLEGIRRVGWWTFFKRLRREIVDDVVFDNAAQLSYYFLFSLFPFLFFVATLLAYLPLSDALDDMLGRLAPFMPAAAFELIAGHLTSLINQPRPNLLTLGAVTTFWSASRGVDAFRKSLNLAYDVRETRPFWKTQLLAVGMTVAGAVLILVALLAVVLGGKADALLSHRAHFGAQFHDLFDWARWPVAALAAMTAAALNYYFLPDVRQRFRFITPGSVLGTLAWLAATWGFTQYVEHFGTFNVTYGSIGGVIVLLLWLYVSSVIFILGGELNATIEQLSREGKARGARDAGEAPEAPELRPSAMPPGAAKRADSAKRAGWKALLSRVRRRRQPPVEPVRH